VTVRVRIDGNLRRIAVGGRRRRYDHPVASIVLRVRLIAGDRLDVSYDDAAAAAPAQAMEHAVAALAEPSGMIRVRHGDRIIVLYARGVAAIEVEPRGAVL